MLSCPSPGPVDEGEVDSPSSHHEMSSRANGIICAIRWVGQCRGGGPHAKGGVEEEEVAAKTISPSEAKTSCDWQKRCYAMPTKAWDMSRDVCLAQASLQTVNHARHSGSECTVAVLSKHNGSGIPLLVIEKGGSIAGQ